MKKVQLIAAAILLTLTSLAQGPVRLSYQVEKLDPKTYAIHITAEIAQGWHIYSQDQPKQAISRPTLIKFTNSPLFVWKGKPVETGNKEKYEDKTADIIQYQYAGTVEFVQTVMKSAPVKGTVSGSITYQACTEEQCEKPQTVSFSIPIE